MIALSLKNWPENRKGEPIFTCTEDAFLYGRMVARKGAMVEALSRINGAARREFDKGFERAVPQYTSLLNLAMRMQFTREALEEVERVLNPPPGVPVN